MGVGRGSASWSGECECECELAVESLGEKRQRFVEAGGQLAEAAPVADVAQRLGFGSRVETDRLKQLAGESSAMLTALIARFAS